MEKLKLKKIENKEMEELFIGKIVKIKNKKTQEILNVKIKGFENGKPIYEKIDNSKINVIIDSRENITFKKELYKNENINLVSQKLEVGDILLDNYLGIERKTLKDFVNSILDKRLFTQLKDLATNYRRPLLIIEGEENLLSIRNLNPNIILSSLISVQVDYRIPIIFTKNTQETISQIELIVKRRLKLNKNLQVNSKKSSNAKLEELENFIGAIPKLNKTTAKKLLIHFKTIKNLINSNELEIEKCVGIGKVRAKFLYNFFKEKYE